MTESKFCSLKKNQKLFIIQNNLVSSCCRAEQEPIDSTKSIEFYIDKWDHEKQLLTQGVEIPGCESCWRDERRGLQSYRQQLKQIILDDKSADYNKENYIEIFLSNLCNQMCSYCSPKYSSEWEQSILENPFENISYATKQNLAVIQTNNDSDYWLNQIQQYVNTQADNSVTLRLLGGEPLMQLRNLEIFKQFNLQKIKQFHIVTNLNAPTSKFLLWLLESIASIQLKIQVSIDATPEYNHIPRAKFNSQRFNSNLTLLKNHNIEIEFLSVLSVLNLFDLPNFLAWAKDNNYKVVTHSLNNPDCLNVQTVPIETRMEILKSIEQYDPDPIIRENLLDNSKILDIKLYEQYNYLNQYFQRNNITTDKFAMLHQYWTDLEKRFKK